MATPPPKPGTHAARILDELKKHPDGASDGQLARILVTRHEIVNSNCRLMEAQGLITRERQGGVIINKVLVRPELAGRATTFGGGIRHSVDLPSGISPPDTEMLLDDASVRDPSDHTAHTATPTGERPWSWEGNVQAAVATFLERRGWAIVRTANTATREPGKDIEAVRSGSTLWVTVKGLPLAHPSAQARLWFADAIFDVVRYRQEDAAALIAVALPESPLYQRWQERAAWLQRATPFDYLWVNEDGTVRYDPGQPSIL